MLREVGGLAMVVKARLRLRHAGCISETIQGAAHVTQISADERADILVLSGADPQGVAAFLCHIVATQESPPDILVQTPHSAVVRGRNPRGGATATITAAGATILWPAVWEDGVERYTVLLPSREALARLLAPLRALGEVEVEALADVEPDALPVVVSIGDFTSALTRRQLDVLRLAIAMGYFDNPRRVTTGQMARVLGISRSTFDEHLRKACGAVLRRVDGLLDAHPVLEAHALKRPGRPRTLHRGNAIM